MKTKIGIIAGGILLIVLLFLLPRTVVENEQDEAVLPATDQPDLADTRSTLTDSRPEMDPAQAGNIAELRQEVRKNKADAGWIPAVDSLAAIYVRSGWLDSAAYYKGLKAEYLQTIATYLEAGDYWYEAFSTATTEEQAAQRLQQVEKYFGNVLQLDSDNVEARYKLAITAISGPEPMKGILDLRRIADEHPEFKEAQFQLGLLSIRSGQYEKAAERFQQVVALDSTDMQGRYFLGIVYADLNQKKLAREQFEWLVNHSDDEEIVANATSQLDQLR